MKSRNKKRLLALVLCMVVAISNSSFIFASETGQAEYPQEAEVQTQDEAVADDMDVAAYAADEGQAVADEQPAAVEQVAAEQETTAETPAAEQPAAEAPAAEQPTTEAPAAQASVAQASVAQEPATVSEGATTTSENTNAAVGEAQTPQGEENGETVTYNQEMNLKQDFKDELGNVVATVSAEIPEGAFQVGESSQITMEVNTLTDTEKTQLENLMKEKIPAEKELGQYVAYNIRFKVDGTETESLQPIKITMTGDKTQIDDVENATVFYLDPADPTVPGDKDELEEIIQRVALIKSLQEAGQSIENIDEDYDLSDITLGTDGAAEKIQLEGRTSTIYGCYVESTFEEDTKEDDVTDEEPTEDDRLNTVSAATESQVTLQEDNGKLVASYTANDSEEYGYVWYRSINGSEFVAQEPTTYTGMGSDIKEDGTELYIALNGGALGYTKGGVKNTSVAYKVKVFKKKDIGNNGLPLENTTAIGESAEYLVASYYELQNGSFEKPEITYNRYINMQFSNDDYKNQGGVWQTTGVNDGRDIEIVNAHRGSTFRASYSWHGQDGAQDGEQFAELNCEAAGALYQDILTTPGETLNYQLYHRARGTDSTRAESDTMYVLIMSTKMAIDNKVTTQAKVMDVINNPNNYSGAMVATYTDDDLHWYLHTGAYQVPNNSQQYSTRMFFVSGATAAPANAKGEYTVGNFLDDIKLTRERLIPVDKTATITLTKTISGLKFSEANTLAQHLQFTIGSQTIRPTDMRYTWVGDSESYGEYTSSYVLTIQERELGKELKVKEVASGSSLDVDGYTRTTSVSVNGKEATNGTESVITVNNKDTATVNFENAYVISGGGGGGSTTPDEPETSVLHEKYIKRNDKGTYNITLNVSGTIGTETKKANLDVVLVVDTSGSMGDKVSGQKTRLDMTKEAIEGLISTFDNKKTVDVRYKLVTFSDNASLLTNQWVTGESLKTAISNLEANGGTNYDRGLSVGSGAIATSQSEENRSNPQKIVIFLTDGQPTLYGNGSGGGNYTNVNTYNSALTAARKINCDKFYAVGIGLPGEINIYSYKSLFGFSDRIEKTLTGLELLQEIVGCATASTKEASNLDSAAGLGEKFQNLAGEILQYACKKVEISDTLSKYVDTTKDSRLVIKEVKKENDTYTDLESHIVNLDSAGVEVALKSGDKAMARYDSNTKTATLTFPDNYELKKDHYYYLTITNVKPSEEAFYEYQTNGKYPHTGAIPSDASSDEYKAVSDGTSSGQLGFKSNSSAKVTYTYKDKPHEESYTDPVIQVDTVSHTVVKEWSKGLNKVPVQVELKAYVEQASEDDVTANNPKYLTQADAKNLPTQMQVELSENGGWTYTWENLPSNYFYKVGDTIKQTPIHYTVEEVQTDATKEFYGQVTESENGKITTITNKKKNEEDKPFIKVTKTFEGLTKDQIIELASAESPYKITVTKVGTNPEEIITLKMDKDKMQDYLVGDDTSKVWTYTWKLENCSESTYSVVESGYEKTGYGVSVTVNNEQITSWENVTFPITEAKIQKYEQRIKEPSCSKLKYKVGEVNLIVAKLTKSEGYFVWTDKPISINERKAIVNLISTGIGFNPPAELNKCYFYSGNGIKDALVFRNGEIKYDGQQYLQFDASKQWAMFAAGKYEFVNTQNAEIQITNKYTEKTANLDLVKTSVNETPFDGAEFKLYKKNGKGAYELQKFNYTDESGTIQVINADGSEAELKNLPSGQYYLEEVKAPAACMLLADKIYFKQEKGMIILTDKDGKQLTKNPDMWTLTGDTGNYVLTVKNEIIYDLPSTGHSGIFNVMMSGILLMFAGVLIIFKLRGKEVLKK